MNETFERFVSHQKNHIRLVMREISGEFGMPTFSDAKQLKKHFEESYLGKPCTDDIDWEALEKELSAYSYEVIDEWQQRKSEIARIKRIQLGLEDEE
jgi:hypothetical protein